MGGKGGVFGVCGGVEWCGGQMLAGVGHELFVTLGVLSVFKGWGRAGMPRGTKVEWECERDFLWWKNAVFLGWWGA
jgi:hypothetical protein